MLYHTFSTQEEIDQAYNPRLIVENTDELIQSYFSESKRVLRKYPHRSGVAYGPTRAETLDIFTPKRPVRTESQKKTPLHIFIHGGYWHSLRSRDFAFVAEDLLRNGITAVLVNYALCPAITLDEIVRQCRAATAWTYRNAESFGGNPEQITVSGHSAGGHLSGMLLTTAWKKDYGLPPDLLKGCLTISGLFDLAPFPYSWLQPKLQLTAEQVLRNSPILRKPLCAPPVVVAVGAEESGEFQRQSEIYAAFLQEQGVPATLHTIPGKNHFNIIQDFWGEGGPLYKMLS